MDNQRSRRDGAPLLVRAGGSSGLQPLGLEAAGTSGANRYDEAFLQDLLFRHPTLLPVGEIEGVVGDDLVAVCREFPTKHGPIDNLFMTAEGHIVVTEVKLWRNPEARRKVVAQALDYASCLFEMGYGEFEAAVLRASHGDRKRPTRLWELFPESSRLPEAQFVDNVSRNLRRGRIVVLVVGDGIREEAERLADTLQGHAALHFTFALIELSLFQLPEDGGIVVLPRTLARTLHIPRGVVVLEGVGGDAAVLRAPAPLARGGAFAATPSSISAEEFFEAIASRGASLPAKLKAFVAALEPLGIYPEFRRALNLKWDAPNGRTLNLGIVQRDGQVWTSELGIGEREPLNRAYNEALAAAWRGEARSMHFGPGQKWQVYVNGKVPHIDFVAERLDAWKGVLVDLVPRLASALGG